MFDEISSSVRPIRTTNGDVTWWRTMWPSSLHCHAVAGAWVACQVAQLASP